MSKSLALALAAQLFAGPVLAGPMIGDFGLGGGFTPSSYGKGNKRNINDEPAAPAPYSEPVPTPSLLAQLAPLPPLQQIELVQEKAAENPLAQDVAAAIVKPELLERRKDTLAARLGPDDAAALARLAVALHIEAKADDKVRAGLDGLAQKIAPEGRLELVDLAAASTFDGRPAAASGAPRLSPATVWPVEDGSTYERRVHTLSAQGGQFLINGKPAERLREARGTEGLVKETFLHPSDPTLMVKLYQSASLEGFERKSAKIENLTPLSLSGAAPKVIEHGEAAVDGKGRVYFYVQELADGTLLRDLLPEERPIAQVRATLARLAQAGFALVVPGPDQNWLLSHLMLGKTASGGAGVYLLGGTVERASPEEAAAQHAMLLSVLATAPLKSGAERPAKKPAAPAPVVKAEEAPPNPKALHRLLQLIPDSPERDALILKISPTVYAKTESGEVAAILGLLSQSGAWDVYKILPTQVWRALSRADMERVRSRWEAIGYNAHAKGITRFWVEARTTLINGGNGHDFFELLSLLPESGDRDAAILKIPSSAYLKTASADVAALIDLLKKDDALKTHGQLAPEAWRRLALPEAETLVRNWVSRGKSQIPAALAALWLGAHPDELTPKETFDFLSLIPGSEYRDAALAAVPASSYSKMTSAEAAAVLALVTPHNPVAIYERFPEQAWRALARPELEALMKKWTALAKHQTPTAVLRLWLSAQSDWEKAGTSGQELHNALKLVAESGDRNAAIAKIPVSAYAKMTGGETAAVLALFSKDNPYRDVPREAWRALSRADLETLIRRWVAAAPSSAANIARLWIAAHQDRLAATAEEGRELVEILAAIPNSGELDEAFLKIPAATWAKISGTDAATALQKIYTADVFSQIPKEAWHAVTRPDMERLIRKVASSSGASALAAWMAAQESRLGAGVTGDDFVALVEQVNKDHRSKAASKVPAKAFASMSGSKAAAFAIRWHEINEISPQMWQAMSFVDMESQVEKYRAASQWNVVAAIVRHWMSANAAHVGEPGATAQDIVRLIQPFGTLKPDVIRRIPTAAYAKMDTSDVIMLMKELTYERCDVLPKEAWRKFTWSALQAAEQTLQWNHNAQAIIDNLWKAAQG